MEDEDLRFCFNIDVTEDEFYQNILDIEGKPDPVNIFYFYKQAVQNSCELLRQRYTDVTAGKLMQLHASSWNSYTCLWN